jgi:hypothetical protein
MAGSIFTPIGGRDQYHGGTFRAEDVVLTWTGINPGIDGPAALGRALGGALRDAITGAAPTEGALVQEAQWRCARQVNILYEIGSPAVYYVGNRRSGSASFRRVVAGKTTFQNMAQKFGDICNPADMVIDARQKPCGTNITGGGVKYTLKDATINELGGAVQAESVVINENMSFVFVDMYYA